MLPALLISCSRGGSLEIEPVLLGLRVALSLQVQEAISAVVGSKSEW